MIVWYQFGLFSAEEFNFRGLRAQFLCSCHFFQAFIGGGAVEHYDCSLAVVLMLPGAALWQD